MNNKISKEIYYDIYEKIYNFIYNIKDALNFRLINKYSNNAFINNLKNIKIDIIPHSTFININECDICYKKCKRNNNNNNNNNYKNIKINRFNQLIYAYDRLPNKCIIHCNNKYCHLSAVKKYLIDIKRNNIYPFCILTSEFLYNNYEILINNKKHIILKYFKETIRKYNNNWYIKCDLLCTQNYIQLNTINNIIDYNLFNWYLNRKPIFSKCPNNMD